MSLELQQIGYFQFENLIQNRIPFLLLHFGQDLKAVFLPHHLRLAQVTSISVAEKLRQSQFLMKVFFRDHFRRSSMNNLIEEMDREGYSKDHAIVVLCAKGDSSRALVEALLRRGFQNCFYIPGGLEQLKQDAKMNA